MPRSPPNLAAIRASLDRLDALALAHPKLTAEASRERLADALETLDEETNMGRPPKDEADRKGVQIALRLTSAEVDRLDALAAAMSASTGLEVQRAATMRAALAAGLEVLEGRNGIAAAKPAAPKGGAAKPTGKAKPKASAAKAKR